MKYSELIEKMHQFRNGEISKLAMVRWFEIWQLPEKIFKEGR